MIPEDRLVLLDTNVLILLTRGSYPGQKIDTDYQLRARAERPLICVVSIGEALSLAKKFNWGRAKCEVLSNLFRELVVVDVNDEGVLERYAEIDAYLEGIGKPIGQNDAWIAAAASTAGAVVLTTDKDFDHVHPKLAEREWVDPERLKPPKT